MSLVITHARALDARGEQEDAWAHVDGGYIVETGTGRGPAAGTVIDAHGAWLTPGFIDLHAHGGGGSSFEGGAEAISDALAVHRAHGTTRSVISLVANPVGDLVRALDQVAELADLDPLVLGSHLEGPFLAPTRAGAHNSSHLRAPAPEDIQQLLRAARGTLRQVTVAPELPGALEAIDSFVAAGVVVAVGHTEP